MITKTEINALIISILKKVITKINPSIPHLYYEKILREILILLNKDAISSLYIVEYTDNSVIKIWKIGLLYHNTIYSEIPNFDNELLKKTIQTFVDSVVIKPGKYYGIDVEIDEKFQERLVHDFSISGTPMQNLPVQHLTEKRLQKIPQNPFLEFSIYKLEE